MTRKNQNTRMTRRKARWRRAIATAGFASFVASALMQTSQTQRAGVNGHSAPRALVEHIRQALSDALKEVQPIDSQTGRNNHGNDDQTKGESKPKA